jgi:Mycothiol maleylpyruvate isomerase N-terminal domain
MNREQLFARIHKHYGAFKDCLDGVSARHWQSRGVLGDWTLKDVVCHVTTWEEEALKALPLIMQGMPPPRYVDVYGGLDAFNELQRSEKADMSVAAAHVAMEATHRDLLAFLERVDESWFVTETPFRRRLRLDTYSHYQEHTKAVWDWRRARGW